MNTPLIPAMLLMPERHAPLVGGKASVRIAAELADQAGGADALDDPEHDQPDRAGRSGHPVDGEQQREPV